MLRAKHHTARRTINRSTRIVSQIAVNDVIQIDPAFDAPVPEGKGFGGCFAIVSEVKSWGVQAYIASPGVEGLAYIRVPTDKFVRIGRAEWAGEAEGR